LYAFAGEASIGQDQWQSTLTFPRPITQYRIDE